MPTVGGAITEDSRTTVEAALDLVDPRRRLRQAREQALAGRALRQVALVHAGHRRLADADVAVATEQAHDGIRADVERLEAAGEVVRIDGHDEHAAETSVRAGETAREVEGPRVHQPAADGTPDIEAGMGVFGQGAEVGPVRHVGLAEAGGHRIARGDEVAVLVEDRDLARAFGEHRRALRPGGKVEGLGIVGVVGLDQAHHLVDALDHA